MILTKAPTFCSASAVAPTERTIAKVFFANNVRDSLALLECLQDSNLQIKWREFFSRNAPARFGPELMKRAIAYRVQEMTYGGLSRPIQLRLNAAMKYAGMLGSKAVSPGPLIKSGTRFVREWNGETHEVVASEVGGFAYRGKAYRSLSVIAREITGAHQSGPRFFGIDRKRPGADAPEVPNG